MSTKFTPADLPKIDDIEIGPKPAYEAVPVKRTPTAFVDERGMLCVSAEDGQGLADYYGEFRGGYPWVHPVLEEWAESNGCYWEWRDPGSIVLVD